MTTSILLPPSSCQDDFLFIALRLEPVEPTHDLVGSHKDQDQRLNDRDDVNGDAGLKLHRRRAVTHGAEEQRCRDDCRRDGSCRAGQWRSSRSHSRRKSPACDSSSAPPPRRAPASPASPPESAIASTMLRRDVDAGILGDVGVGAHRANLKALHRLPQEPEDDNGHDNGQDSAPVHAQLHQLATHVEGGKSAGKSGRLGRSWASVRRH